MCGCKGLRKGQLTLRATGVTANLYIFARISNPSTERLLSSEGDRSMLGSATKHTLRVGIQLECL